MVPPVPPMPAAMGMAPAVCSAREQSSAQGWRHQEPTRALAASSAQLLCTNTAPQASQSGCFLWRGTWQGSVCQKFHAVLRAREIFRCEAFPPSLPPAAAPGCSKAGSCHSCPHTPWPWLLHAPGLARLYPSLPLPAACPACCPPGASSWCQLGGSRAVSPAGSLQGRAIPTRHHVSCASLEEIHLPCVATAGRVLQTLSRCCSWCLCCHLMQCHQPRVGGFSVSAGCW